LTALSVWIMYNAYPDYNDLDSWEGTLDSLSRFFGCRDTLKSTVVPSRSGGRRGSWGRGRMPCREGQRRLPLVQAGVESNRQAGGLRLMGTRRPVLIRSEPATKQIASSLAMLFGGIDLDPSDRLLGLYLVSAWQRHWREAHVLRALAEAGAPVAPRAGSHEGSPPPLLVVEPGLPAASLQSTRKPTPASLSCRVPA
jgi:hypothetical protein